MQGLTLIKTCLFRSLAIILLAVSAGFVMPDSNPYSADKTFVKAHAPADNFVLLLTADDKEDIDEDGAMDVQLSHDFFSELVLLVAYVDGCKANVKPLSKMSNHQAYIFHRQLLI